MNPYGDGSGGALNVTGTTSLPLDTKFQYTTVNIANGATLTTNSTSGSVLYICATNSITINGTIDVSNKVLPGQRTWSTVIDGVTYSTPSTGQGGAGAKLSANTTANGAFGFGGGGAGGTAAGIRGGNGGSGSLSKGTQGYGGWLDRSYRGVSGTATKQGEDASGSMGGGGAARINVYNRPVVYVHSGTGPFSYSVSACGGGGAGGVAGKAGVHVVLIAPIITINGTILAFGTNGGNGGNGGRERTPSGLTSNYAQGGGGGGGGNSGNLYLKYGSAFYNSGTVLLNGGLGGDGGAGGISLGTFASDGVDGNDGEVIVQQIAPVANFSATPVSGQRPLSVNFTNTSQGATSYSWNFGDSSGSSATSPTHVYSTPGTYTVALTVTNGAGSNTMTKTSYITVTVANYDRSISGTLKVEGTLLFGGGARAVLIRDAEGLQGKRYLYKVYDPDGNYIEVWKDVISELNYTHEINTIGSTTSIELARNSDTVGVSISPLLTESGQNITTEDGLDLLVATESKNQIGSGSSVDYNNRVDIYAFYGRVEPLYTESMEEILTEDDEVLLADIGAPNGVRVFTGFISEINSRYGNSETTLVQLTSYGWDLDQFPLTQAGKTTVAFNSQDPSVIAQTAVDLFRTDSSAYGTYTDRTDSSISTTGTVVSYTFRSNTYKDVLDKTLQLMPYNWYYRIGLGDNTVYYRERQSTPTHLFYLGKHIEALDLRGSIMESTNRVLYTGGGDPALYLDRSDVPADRTRRTLKVMSDSRVTLLDSAEIIADGEIENSNKRLFRTGIEILSGQYDIESINVGDTVGFRNFGSEVDTFVMQVVGLTYSPDTVQLQLETKPPTISKRLEDIKRQLTVTENQNLPNSPTT